MKNAEEIRKNWTGPKRTIIDLLSTLNTETSYNEQLKQSL